MPRTKAKSKTTLMAVIVLPAILILGFLIVPSVSTPKAILEWKFNNNLLDSSGNHYDGISGGKVQNTVTTFVDTSDGTKAAKFTGINYVANFHVDKLNPQKVTVSLDVDKTQQSTNYQTIFSVFGGRRLALIIEKNSYNVDWIMDKAIDQSGNAVFLQNRVTTLDDKPHHFDLIYDGTLATPKLTVVVDKQITKTFDVAKIAPIENSVFVGISGTSSSVQTYYYYGTVKNFQVYPDIVSPTTTGTQNTVTASLLNTDSSSGVYVPEQTIVLPEDNSGQT